eukprot:TRINITY_DN18724_c0_g2_i2.p1 TRINITY_DN18724_c0_g2~~TRINITY_DN18724_c0_g2_i2.p1  ORF type:complete len:271 (+),score=31.88 TRINITY_DN18724_c0_g2_i2:47-814(+)
MLTTALIMTVILCTLRVGVSKWEHAKVKWRIIGLTVMWAWALKILRSNSEWGLFDMWKRRGENDGTEKKELDLFIAYQLSWYAVLTIESLITDWGRRSDFAMLVVHHFMSLWLVYTSVSLDDAITLRMHRMAVFIPVLDVSEILVLCYKLSKRSEWDSVTPHLYALTVLAWFAIRVCLAFVMLYTTWVDMPVSTTFCEVFAVSLISLLYVMNVVWFSEILEKYYAVIEQGGPQSGVYRELRVYVNNLVSVQHKSA